MNTAINSNIDKLEMAKLGYQMATNMVGILGNEIYSRFNAMLTANSIIIAVYGFIFSEKNNMPDFLKRRVGWITLDVFIQWCCQIDNLHS